MRRLMMAATAALLVAPALAMADPLNVGLVATLSGQSAVLGQQARDGFTLALKQLGGKLGGVETHLTIIDDELKPDVALTKVRTMLEREHPEFVVGPIFSNVLGAIVKPVTDAHAFLISDNAGPSSLAGKTCNPFFLTTSYQNDQIHAVLGHYAQAEGYKRVITIVPNYQAGRDAVAGFKRDFKGEVIDELYVPLGQLDYSAELARIAAAKPDAVFAFVPGGMGVSLVKQYHQAGLTIPVLSAFTVDESTLPAQGDAAVGMLAGSNWAPTLDTPENKAFMIAFEAEYHYIPATYAFQAFDAAMLIDGTVRDLHDKLDDPAAVRAALLKADFKSLRGPMTFSSNGFPVQNFYLTKVAKRADGKYQTEIVQTVYTNFVDDYAKDCPLH
jgi:branched-chain amino acid transport system substrate-binding protein